MFKISNLRPPRPSLKSIIIGGLGGAVGVASAIVGVGAYIVETLIKPKRLGIFSLFTFSPFELGIPAEEVIFPPLHGNHSVNGWYIPHPEATSTLVLSPGYRSSKSDVLGLSGLLWREKHNILMFEYYGHGTVVGSPVTLGYRELNDFLGAIQYARQRAPEARIGALGYSMGAAISIMGSARTTEVEAVIADSAFATHRSVIEYAVHRTLHLPFFLFSWVTDILLWLRAGYHLNQVEPLRDIARLSPRPVLIIHGTGDSIVDPLDAPRLYKAANEPKELWIVDGVEHCGAYFADRAAYVSKVAEFFDTHLRKNPPVVQSSSEPGTIATQISSADAKQLSEAG
ncbi:MAG TPA: alpha/beta hydrolase [Dictyobacter sp.]|jgi:fermentation-respiration switch protein FrsA (DUF1100 family)|nr:alpha/beta hydrolase [Dictyobacter sp.]